MSPEQAKGFTADQRSDVFAFGCVLYEMLAGKAAFEGDTVSEIIAAVLKSEPDFNRLPADLNPRVRELLARALAKNLKRRWQAIGDVRIDIESAGAVSGVHDRPTPARHSRLAWIVAAVATLAFASLAVMYFQQKPIAAPNEMRVEITTPSTPAPLDFALISRRPLHRLRCIRRWVAAPVAARAGQNRFATSNGNRRGNDALLVSR
jgi:serine/threonine protein kinase